MMKRVLRTTLLSCWFVAPARSLSSVPTRRETFSAVGAVATASVANVVGAAVAEDRAPSWDDDASSSSSFPRYSSSSRWSATGAPVAASPAPWPSWTAGWWSVRHAFRGASFPAGRRALSLRTAGAGSGTCAAVPNVGYAPRAPVPQRFVVATSAGRRRAYEDAAYNAPRVLEAFWPAAAVTAVATPRGREAPPSETDKCRVDGDNRAPFASRAPSSRLVMDYDAPTRRGGSAAARVPRSLDVTLTAHREVGLDDVESDRFSSVRTYSQYNVEQDLPTFYRVFTTLERTSPDELRGTTRVAAFLPKSVRALDAGVVPDVDYDERLAVALYDYDLQYQRIDEQQAAAM